MKEFLKKVKFETWLGLGWCIAGVISKDKNMIIIGTIFLCTARVLIELDNKR